MLSLPPHLTPSPSSDNRVKELHIPTTPEFRRLEQTSLRSSLLTPFPVAVPDNFLIIAHRGASGYAPDHSRLAFDLAKNIGARHVEIDTQLSKDGEIVLCHDETLKAYGHPGRIRDLPYHGCLEHLDMGSHKDPKFSDARMMTLGDLFREYGRTFRYHVELKSGQAELPAALVKAIKEHNMEDNVVFTSGRPTMLQAVKELAPEIPRAYLVRYADERVLRIAARLEVEQLCPRADLVTPELVSKWKEVAPIVRAWGVAWLTKDINQYRWRVEQVVRSGCDGTTIDHPDHLVHSSDAQSPTRSAA